MRQKKERKGNRQVCVCVLKASEKKAVRVSDESNAHP